MNELVHTTSSLYYEIMFAMLVAFVAIGFYSIYHVLDKEDQTFYAMLGLLRDKLDREKLTEHQIVTNALTLLICRFHQENNREGQMLMDALVKQIYAKKTRKPRTKKVEGIPQDE